MIQLQVTDRQQEEMAMLLLEFGERHDLSMAETLYCVVGAIAHYGYSLAKDIYGTSNTTDTN